MPECPYNMKRTISSQLKASVVPFTDLCCFSWQISPTQYSMRRCGFPSQNGRGTWSILYSCVFTLSLCVWSEIHLNIPPRGEHEAKQWIRNTKCVFIAIFAPEVVFHSAWQQYYLARPFTKEMKNIYREQHNAKRQDDNIWWEDQLDQWITFFDAWFDGNKGSDSDPPPRSRQTSYRKASTTSQTEARPEEPKQVNEFSLTYGYFVLMGGFIINASEFYDDHRTSSKRRRRRQRIVRALHNAFKHTIRCLKRIFGGDLPKGSYDEQTSDENADEEEHPFWITITPRGVVEFAKILPWKEFRSQFCIDEESIKDKSKADGLTKLLVTFQVLWATLNSTSRVALGYSISVLEIHTLVHAACALLMYGLWFSKHFYIKNSTIVQTEFLKDRQAFREKLALMLVRHPGSAYAPFTRFKLPDLWTQFGSSQEPHALFRTLTWPDKSYACEAAFMCFDSTKLHRSFTEEGDPDALNAFGTYSIFHRLPPLTEGEEKGSTPQAARSLSDSHSSSGPVDDQIGYEAQLGINMQPLCPIPSISMPATVHRTSLSWDESAYILSTGEFLPSGIGPSAYITTKRLSPKYQKWYKWIDSIPERFPSVRQLLEDWRSPEQDMVPADECLVPCIRLPPQVEHMEKGGRLLP